MKIFAIYLITDGEFQEVWPAELDLIKNKDDITVEECLREGRLKVGKTKLQEGGSYPKALVDLITIDDSKVSKDEGMALLQEQLEKQRIIWSGTRLTENELVKIEGEVDNTVKQLEKVESEAGEIVAELSNNP